MTQNGAGNDSDVLQTGNGNEATVGQRDGRVNRRARFQSGIGRPFTGAMDAHQGFEKIHVGQSPGLGTLLAYHPGLIVRGANSLFILGRDPLEDRGDVILIQGGPCVGDSLRALPVEVREGVIRTA